MPETSGLSKPDQPGTVTKQEAEPPAGSKKLAVMNSPHREIRPVTNLGKVFGQFADLQQQIAEQVEALEDSVHHQKQDIAEALAQLPELRERINWLSASFYEQSKKDESVRERLNRHEAALAALAESARTIQEAKAQWQAALDEVIASLQRAKAIMGPSGSSGSS